MTFTMMPLIGAGGYAESGNTANTVVTRTTMLDLTSTAGKYMATDGTENTVDFTNTSVIDSAEGEDSGDGADFRPKPDTDL